jgi:hypothetical protein
MNFRFPQERIAIRYLLACLLTMGASSSAIAQNPSAVSPSEVTEDYNELAKPEIAAAVKLTDEQKTSIQQLITERDAAVAAANESARPAIITAANEKIKAVLTSEQQRLFVSLFGGKTLRFNFRNMKWPDVLTWISKEADLSLVMDTPPPGTFTYADSKDYSTTDAIDLLNGWLLTKGFTLVRRERMLMCLDLKGGLPEGTIPRVTLAELATRGRYEFVSVLIPLEGRPPESVLLEVKPLLGTFGKAEPLAQTQQILVFDTAANLRVIEQIVQKIPIPQKPVTPPAVEPPKPVLAVYPIQHANPRQAAEVLKQIVAGTVVVDEKALQISINAIPAEQDKAKTILAQLESNQGPDSQPKLQLYSVSVSDADQMLATLKLVAPDGQYRVDPVSGKLIAWATERDQAHIAESLEMIQADQLPSGARQLQVYALKNAEPGAVSTILATVVPTARITVNAATRSLIAFGTLADHEVIRALIEQLETQADSAATKKSLKFYDVAVTGAADTRTLLASRFTDVTFVATAEGNKLMAWVSPDQDERIQTTLEQLVTEKPFQANRTMELYSIRDLGPSASTVLSQTVPTATITPGSRADQLAIVAAAADHEKIRKVLEQLQGAKLKPELKFYPLKKASGPTSLAILQSITPQASITFQADGNRYSVLATPNDHEAIAAVLEQLEGGAEDIHRDLKFYDVAATGAADTRTLLASRFTDVTFVATAEGNKLMAWVSPDQDERIRATLDQLLTEKPFQANRTMELYSIRDLGPSASTVLSQTVPTATITPGSRADQLAIVATAADHEKIRKVLEQLQGAKLKPELKFYPLKKVSGPTSLAILQSITPQASITFQADGNRYSVLATPNDHEAIAAVLEQLEAGAEDIHRDLKFYDVAATGAADTRTLLLSRFTDVTFVTTAEGNMLMAWVSPDQDERIRATLDQLLTEKPFQANRTMELYSIRDLGPSASTVLSQTVPTATITPGSRSDQLAIVATATDHEKIRKVLEQLQGAKLKPELKFYPLKKVSGPTSLAILQSITPQASFTFQADANRYSVLATPNDHESIAAVLEQLEAGAEDIHRDLKFYDVAATGAADTRTLLSSRFTDVTFRRHRRRQQADGLGVTQSGRTDSSDAGTTRD